VTVRRVGKPQRPAYATLVPVHGVVDRTSSLDRLTAIYSAALRDIRSISKPYA
jgi:hypothetical protein